MVLTRSLSCAGSSMTVMVTSTSLLGGAATSLLDGPATSLLDGPATSLLGGAAYTDIDPASASIPHNTPDLSGRMAASRAEHLGGIRLCSRSTAWTMRAAHGYGDVEPTHQRAPGNLHHQRSAVTSGSDQRQFEYIGSRFQIDMPADVPQTRATRNLHVLRQPQGDIRVVNDIRGTK